MTPGFRISFLDRGQLIGYIDTEFVQNWWRIWDVPFVNLTESATNFLLKNIKIIQKNNNFHMSSRSKAKSAENVQNY